MPDITETVRGEVKAVCDEVFGAGTSDLDEFLDTVAYFLGDAIFTEVGEAALEAYFVARSGRGAL